MADIFSNLLGVAGSALKGFSGEAAAESADKAAAAQAAATDRATQEAQRQFNVGQENLAPWLSAGKQALGSQQALMGMGGDTVEQMRQLQSAPGYQFRLSQGQRALDAGLSSRGGMGSGKAMNAATQYGQDYASNEYGNRLNQLAGMSGTGQSTAGGMAGMGNQFAQNQGSLLTQGANAQGAAGMAGANARQSGLANLANLATSWFTRPTTQHYGTY